MNNINNMFFFHSVSDLFQLSKFPGHYNEPVCEPYYMENTKSNQEILLYMMRMRNITKVWLYVNRVNLHTWKWLNGETYGG